MIILIRHIDWNKLLDKPTLKGLKHLEILKKRLKKILNNKKVIIFSSPLKKALFTAKEIAKMFNANVIISIFLKERNEGIAKIFFTFHENFLEFLCKITKTKYTEFKPIAGESVEDVKNRTQKFIELYLKKIKNKNVIIVTHHSNIISFLSIKTKKDLESLFWKIETKGKIFYLTF